MTLLIFFRFLDREAANQEVENPKKAKAMQEKAQKDAAKLLKNFKKIQKKADKINNKDIIPSNESNLVKKKKDKKDNQIKKEK